MTPRPMARTEPPDATEEEPAGEQVVERVRRRSEAVADREVERALGRLEARGDLTPDQRRAVRALADGIVESLVAAPAETVAAARDADEDALAAVVDLFDPD